MSTTVSESTTTNRRTPRATDAEKLTGKKRDEAERRFVQGVVKIISQRKDLSVRFAQLKAEAVDQNFNVPVLLALAARELEDANARVKRLQYEQDLAETRSRLGYQHQLELGQPS